MLIFTKLIWSLLQPVTFLLLSLGMAVMLRSWLFTRICLVLLLIFGVFPVGPALLHVLERQYPVRVLNANDFMGVIILGGSMDLNTKITGDAPQLSASAERFVEGVALARQFPDKIVVFSGGAGAIEHPDVNEAEQVKILMQKLNIDPQRFVFEEKSRTTIENMRELEAMGLREKGRFILVTSAFHMPRSVALFQSHGWEIIPYPAGYMVDDELSLYPSLNIMGNYITLNIAAKEFIGMIASRFY